MFTGIVREMVEIITKHQSSNGANFEVSVGDLLAELNLGDSISVNGVCLTVAEKKTQSIHLEATPETLKLTNLGECSEGDQVNLELPARLADFLGGHLVQGHVDGTGKVLLITKEGNSEIFQVSAPEEVLRYSTLKGSITVNGVSLTISALNPNSFEVTIIPHTLEFTNFQNLRVGDVVNLESDVISKYVASHLNQ